jgi:hypothetical protein
VVDTEGGQGSIDSDSYYLVAAPPGSSQALQIMDGTQVGVDTGSATMGCKWGQQLAVGVSDTWHVHVCEKRVGGGL